MYDWRLMEGLLERDAELARLETWLSDAAAGHGRVAFIGGEAGIGKTALVTTFVGQIDGRARVATGRCDALATPRALGPFLDAADALGVPAPEDRDGLLRSLLEDLRAGPPTLIVIEDAHWADDGTIELFAMLGRRAVDLPLLLVVTYREDEVTAEHPLRLTLGNLATASGAMWLGLRPLSPAAVQTLADAAGVPAGDLYALTCGNPFYVTEALAVPAGTVPKTVRLAVLARATRLPPPARLVLDAVAVVPGRAEDWLVEALCAPPPGAIDDCVRSGVLVAEDGTYAFRHELARLAVELELAEGRRRELHGRAVAALADRPGADPARIAHHAEAAGDDVALARFGTEACRLAFARTAYREAAEHGQRALAVQHLLTPDEAAELKATVGYSLLARSDEAVLLLRAAAEHWRQTGDGRREADALNLLSAALVAVGQTAESKAAGERAIEILEQHPPGRELAGAYLRLTSTYMLARDRDTAVMWGERAISLAGQLGDHTILGRAFVECGIADVMDGRFEGLSRVREGIEIGRRHDLPAIVSAGLLQTGSGCGEMRRYAEAVPALVEGAAFGAEHNLEYNRRYVVAWLGRCRFDLGQWDEAEAHSLDALAGSRSVLIARFVGLNTLGWLRARRGDGDVWPLLDEALELAQVTGHLQRLWPVSVARAEAGWLEDDLARHVPLLEEMLALALRCRHRIAVGEIGVWLTRAGRVALAPVERAAEPFASWLAGDHSGAAAGFRRMGCPYEAASALADRGDTSSLREALATFERLGAVPMADRVAAELRAHGVRVAARRAKAAAHPSGLSDRELEVLTLVAAGFTNPQIAASLYISRKTAEHHVSNILAKLGVTSRTEAATAAVRLGITEP